MATFLMAVGALTVAALGTLTALVAGYLIFDAVNCARFIWRLRIAAIEAKHRLGSWHLFKAWFRYWIGADRRPDYLVIIETNKEIYWPGKEGSRTYPA
nr:hypothetical protein [Ochrobactrum sp. UNC390CL2Tsu3S39]